MTTIKDVAKEAGVSIATVSNYINNKKGMRRETAARIEVAIQKLNYTVQNSGRDLRSSKLDKIGIIFPSISEPYLEKLINSIKGYLRHHNKRYFLELTDAEPALETTAIINAISKKVAGLIIYTCQQDNLGLFEKIHAAEIPYVLIDRHAQDLECNYVSADHYTLFRDLISASLEKGVKRIACVLGPKIYTENQEALRGASCAMDTHGITDYSSRFVCTTAIRECGFKAGIQLLQEADFPELILTNSYLLAQGIHYALVTYHLESSKDIQVICTGDCMQDVFYNDSSILKTSRPSFEIGEQAASILLRNIKSPIVFEKEKKLYHDSYEQQLSQIFPRISQKKAPVFEDEINVLLIDEYSSVISLSQLLPNFYAKEHIKVNIQKISPMDQYSFIEEYMLSGRDDIDVVLFDIPWLTYFASKNYLLCLDEFIHDSGTSFENYIPGILPSFGMHEYHYYAVPFVACMQLLFYRKDLFQNEALKRDFEKQYMLSLRKPTDWLAYNALAHFFTKEHNPSSPVPYGHAMSVSYPENLMCDILPRLWGYKGNLFDSKGHFQVGSSAFKKTMKNLKESTLYSTPDLFQNKPVDTVNSFAKGDCAMLYTFYYFAMGIVDKLNSTVYNDYAVTAIPGNPVLSGWSLGIPKNSKHAQSAFRFIKWASCAEISIPQTILGGQSPNIGVYRNYDLTSLYPWLPLALSEFKNCKIRRTPKSMAGSLISEKKAEDVFFRHIFQYLKDDANAGSFSNNYYQQMLDALEKDLHKLR